MNPDKWLELRTIYVVEAGSRAYGTNTPESDYDYRGACIPPKSYFFGLDNFEQADGKGTGKLVADGLRGHITVAIDIDSSPIWERLPEADITVWSLAKMIKLASDGNPNVRREV